MQNALELLETGQLTIKAYWSDRKACSFWQGLHPETWGVQLQLEMSSIQVSTLGPAFLSILQVFNCVQNKNNTGKYTVSVERFKWSNVSAWWLPMRLGVQLIVSDTAVSDHHDFLVSEIGACASNWCPNKQFKIIAALRWNLLKMWSFMVTFI